VLIYVAGGTGRGQNPSEIPDGLHREEAAGSEFTATEFRRGTAHEFAVTRNCSDLGGGGVISSTDRTLHKFICCSLCNCDRLCGLVVKSS
jgi:hypothetical protein